MGVSIAREEDPAASRRLLEALTARLPEWFAQPEANRHYAEQSEILEAWTDRHEGGAQGLDPDHHRQGIGRALIGTIESRLKQERLRYLFVTTLHPDDPYEPYRRTRAFYERLGVGLGMRGAPVAYSRKSL